MLFSISTTVSFMLSSAFEIALIGCITSVAAACHITNFFAIESTESPFWITAVVSFLVSAEVSANFILSSVNLSESALNLAFISSDALSTFANSPARETRDALACFTSFEISENVPS